MRAPLRFATRVRLAFFAALLAGAGAAAAVASWSPSPSIILALSLAAGITIGLWLLNRVLTPATRTFDALRDGVRGYKDHDFSLNLAVDRRDEIGELVELYNAVGDVLRDERGNLLQKELLLETVLEATPMAIVLTQRDRIFFVNRAARELFVTGRRLEGQPFGRILEECPPQMREVLASGRDSLFSVERGGEEEVYHVARRAFELNGQRHELTMLKHLTPELRRQEVDIWKKAIRTMSHEINNSLAPIASLARSARHILDNPEHQDRLGGVLDVIEERAAHLRDFLESYARFARLPAPVKREVEWRPFLDELRGLFPFSLEGEPPAKPNRFDPGQLQQVLINLLKNAQESGSPPEEIRVAIEPTADGGVRLRVKDRGAGMSDEVMRKALLPFYTSKATGSGLGLPLCREIVEAHGGHLRLESREGRGTSVVCWLPGE
ncbi:MAG TPA: ATP-binding protein [Thermoanaerobaculia bacterium]|nr:ATP-binding protein [Thermoanaerobaculia bacterium]